jgi:hypothetical protein
MNLGIEDSSNKGRSSTTIVVLLAVDAHTGFNISAVHVPRLVDSIIAASLQTKQTIGRDLAEPGHYSDLVAGVESSSSNL